ncbi:uncharacterized protein LOC132039768 [Lycium ferocissimum]|uniref:uncharacterized protein LOC132039768 n=1 Tax=Lycium ferocissimum TaxID=112874 RepID=UPI002815DAF7|nr:uncharacterized protein LOC132039768 [Lycium ferocissimum]
MHQLLAEIWRSLYFSSGLRIGEDTAPNTDNEIDDAVDDVSSGPSAAEQTSAHVSADEPASEDVGTSRRRTTDFAESPSPAKQQRVLFLLEFKFSFLSMMLVVNFFHEDVPVILFIDNRISESALPPFLLLDRGIIRVNVKFMSHL